MGGFILVDPEKEDAAPAEQRHTVLTLDYFKAHPDIKIPKIKAADIEDRSKGDALSKIIAILQTSWFIVQCVARGQQRLALTELELVTLALASLNAVTFAIWWHKPLGVQEPVQIYLQVESEKIKLADEVPWVGAGLTIVCCEDSIFCREKTTYRSMASSARAGDSSKRSYLLSLDLCQRILSEGACSFSSVDSFSSFLSCSSTSSHSLSLSRSPLALSSSSGSSKQSLPLKTHHRWAVAFSPIESSPLCKHFAIG